MPGKSRFLRSSGPPGKRPFKGRGDQKRASRGRDDARRRDDRPTSGDSGKSFPRSDRPFKSGGSPGRFKRKEGGDSGKSFPRTDRPFKSGGSAGRFKREEGRYSGKSFPRSERPFKSGGSPGRFKRKEGGDSGKSFSRSDRPFKSGGSSGRFKREEGRDSGKSFPRSDRPFKAGGGSGRFNGEEGRDSGKSFSRSNRPFKSAYGKSGGKRFEKPGGKRFDKSEGARPRKDEGERSFGPPREKRSFVESRIENQQRQRPEHKEEHAPADGLIRLNKYISNSGVCSRREADDLITAGLITVNGKSVTELGYKVKATDDIRYEGKKLTAEKPVYILLNKPKGFITTTDDPQERNTVMHLIHGACKERVYPVGRLDRNTSGLLLLTNDGELTEKLTHPSHNVKKIYKAELDRPLTKNDFQKILEGVRLEEGKAIVDDLAIISDDGRTVGLEVHIGWNRLVRRIFEALGYDVTKLDRSAYATLDKKELSRGHWRFLRPDEVVRLKHFLQFR